MTTRCHEAGTHCRHIRWGMIVRCCYCDLEPDSPLTEVERQRLNSGIVDAMNLRCFMAAMDQ